MVQVLVNGSSNLRLPGTFHSVFQALLLSTLVIQICSEKYSDFLLPGEEGKFITVTSAGVEHLCHFCSDDCAWSAKNRDCETQNPLSGNERLVPWCNCGPLVGCDPLPDIDNGTYRCWPFGQWKGTTYQTCVPECMEGFSLTQGSTGLRCGEDMKWNDSVVPPICDQKKQEVVLNKEVTPVPSGEPTRSSPPSVTRGDQRPINDTEQDTETVNRLNPVVIGPVGGVIFIFLVVMVSFFCYKYNKKCPQGKSQEQATTVDLSQMDNQELTTVPKADTPFSTVPVHNSSSTVSDVGTRTDEDSINEYVPLLQKHPSSEVEDHGKGHTEFGLECETEKDRHDLLSDMVRRGEDTLPSSSLPPLTSGHTMSLPSSWTTTASTSQTDRDQSAIKSLQPTDGSTRLVTGPTLLNSNPDIGPDNCPSSDAELHLESVDPLTLTDFYGSRHEPDGADSLCVPAQQKLPSTQINHYEDQGSEAVKTNVIGISTPCCVRNLAVPAQTHGHHQSEANDPQTPGHHQSEVEEHRTQGHHHCDSSADQPQTDVIGTGECITFSDFQEERDAFKFFSSLDIILVQDTCDVQNWFGVSKWILTPYKVDHLVDYLNGLRVTIQNPPGNAYFDYVIKNEFVKKGVKLGQVLHFFAEKYPNYKIKQLFQKYHPECGYCQKFYDKKKK